MISLIIPCYNVGTLCDSFFESLINQTYTNIELIIVDDGSKDDTKEKIYSYKEQLENKGFIFKYIYQDNKGLGGAINTGLKHFTGEYLCWADPDDYFTDNSFEIRLKVFEENPDVQFIMANSYYGNINKPLNKNNLLANKFPNHKDAKQFYYLLRCDSMLCSGAYMVRSDFFCKVNPEKDIYEAKTGQNYQMLMPIYYNTDVYFLDKPVYFYNTANVSGLSFSKREYDKKIKGYEDLENTIINTLGRMSIPKKENKRIVRLVKNNFFKYRLSAATSQKDKAYVRVLLTKDFIKSKPYFKTILYAIKLLLKGN